MWTSVFDWLLNNYPALVLAAMVGFAVWVIMKFYYTRFKNTEDKVSSMELDIQRLPCGRHDEAFEKILDELSIIRTFLITKNPKTANLFSQKMSPRMLNEAGNRLLDDIDGVRFLNDNADCLMDRMDAKNPKTALDVEVASEILFENMDSDIFDNLKLWVYNSPMRKLNIDGKEQDYAVTIGDVCFILSLPLRDMYLEKHPEIKR